MFESLKRHFARQLRLRNAIARLRRLDDHLLADCGVPREHISEYVRGELH